MAEKDNERKLLWYKFSKANPERHRWSFLAINERRELDMIRQRIYEGLEPIIEERILDRGVYGNTDLFYELFSLESPVNHLDLSRVYQGKIIHDRRLFPRRSNTGWSNLIEKAYHGDI